MEFEERRSSGVAKGGLATGITGIALGSLALLGNGAGLLERLFGGNSGNCYGNGNVMPVPVVINEGGYGHRHGGCCSEDHFVDRYEAAQSAKIAELETQIALRDANTYTDQKILDVYAEINRRTTAIEARLAEQAVQNQKVADSFQLAEERRQCCCDKLADKICDERRARECADNTIVTYANNMFYPVKVADVTTGTETTARNTYNPLPVSVNTGCCCGR